MDGMLEKILKEKKRNINTMMKEFIDIIEEIDSLFVADDGSSIIFIPNEEILSGPFNAELEIISALNKLKSFLSSFKVQKKNFEQSKKGEKTFYN